MKYFLDTEFIEDFFDDTTGRKRHFIDLISIGIKCEDGRELYEISSEYDYNDASNWVKKNVIKPMHEELSQAEQRRWSISEFHKYVGKPKKEIAISVKDFVTLPFIGSSQKPDIQFYAYYGSYDWIALVTLFGTMMELPKQFPKFVYDLKQDMENNGLTQTWKRKNCPDPVGEHNALVDAKWNFELFKKIEQIKKEQAKNE